eukprot:TRINITY_DN6323_c0_g1_i1.p1 TRINITY_DN6323_c0_g1~~TRINITY_DN6323_c0_g1_i1.p1  ORF type:complete len:407 (-),score=64.73 TRINITY_DN6323_c0_g1_i1:97-1317(-)
MRGFLLLLILLSPWLVSNSNAISIVNTTYLIKSVNIDSLNSFRAAIFEMTFDSDVMLSSSSTNVTAMLSSINITSGNLTSSCALGFPPLSCVNPSYAINALYGISNFICGNVALITKPFFLTDNKNNPINGAVLFPGNSVDPMNYFFSQYGIYNFSAPVTPASNKIYAFLFLSYVKAGLPYVFRTVRPTNDDFSQCRFAFNVTGTTWGIVDPSSRLKFIGNSTVPVPSRSTTTCNYFNLVQAAARVTNSFSATYSASTRSVLRQAQYQNALNIVSDAILACQSLTESYLNTSIKTYTYQPTTTCLRSRNDTLFATDPCCNVTLQAYQCCVPRELNVNAQSTISVFDDLVQCKNSNKTISALQDYINNLNIINDPVVGCSAISNSISSEDLLNGLEQYIVTCNTLIK